MAKVLIDPGHGPTCANGGSYGYKEHAGMWDLTVYLKIALERCGIEVGLTRLYNDDPSLEARGAKANGYNLFISQHSNAGGGKGVECYYSVRQSQNKAYAEAFAWHSATVMGTTNRGAKTRYSSAGNADYYGVIRSAVSAGCPRVFLIENGFHDNAQDETWLLQGDNRKKLGEKQANVICDVLGIQYKQEEVGNVVVVPDWQKQAFEQLKEIGFITDSKYWENRLDQPITIGEVMSLIRELRKF